MFSGSLDLAIREELLGKDEDTKNVDTENVILEEKSSEATQRKTKEGRRTNKTETSEEPGEKEDDVMEKEDDLMEKEDDVMDLEEEEEMAIRFRRNSCIHGSRRESLDGMCTSCKPVNF